MTKEGQVQQRLLREMSAFFPNRWEVADMKTRVAGNEAKGTIKIHCTADDKTFMSDFDAKLDTEGRVEEFALDGVVVKRKLGCESAD
jgi:hypothetical protein